MINIDEPSIKPSWTILDHVTLALSSLSGLAEDGCANGYESCGGKRDRTLSHSISPKYIYLLSIIPNLVRSCLLDQPDSFGDGEECTYISPDPTNQPNTAPNMSKGPKLNIKKLPHPTSQQVKTVRKLTKQFGTHGLSASSSENSGSLSTSEGGGDSLNQLRRSDQALGEPGTCQ